MSENQPPVSMQAASAEVSTITDARGRSLEVQRMTKRVQMRMMRQWGAASNVQMWVGNALIACHVKTIDGIPVPPPLTIDQVEALVDRLDDDGVNAVAEWLNGVNAERDMATERDAVKN